MAKNDLARGIRVPRRSEGDEIHGSMIIQGTIPPMALAVDYLSAIASNLGRATAGSLWIGGPNKSFLHIGEEYEGGKPILLFEMASEGGVRFITARTGDNRAFTLGERLDDGTYPIQFTVTVNPNTGTHTAIDPQVLIANAVARTFLLAGRIDLVAGAGLYDAAGATGIRLKAGWGIESKEAGTRSLFWNAATGKLAAGDLGQVFFDVWGFNMLASAYVGLGEIDAARAITWVTSGNTATSWTAMASAGVTSTETEEVGTVLQILARPPLGAVDSGRFGTVIIGVVPDVNQPYQDSAYMQFTSYPGLAGSADASTLALNAGKLTLTGETTVSGQLRASFICENNAIWPAKGDLHTGQFRLIRIGTVSRLYWCHTDDGSMTYWGSDGVNGEVT